MTKDTHLTFRQFMLQEYRKHDVSKDLIFLLEDIATACRTISHKIRSGAFSGTLGATEETNVQGETQKQLDVIANDQFMLHCANCSRVAALVSEELDNVVWLKDEAKAGDYIIYFDPLDGSSNLELNVSVGSIFSIVELKEPISDLTDASVLISGSEQICAGYSLYGPSTSLVVTTGHGVNGFTHLNGTGEFLLTFPDMQVPAETSEYAINASRQRFWEPPVARYVQECLAGEDGPRGRRFNMRWVASMVAEVHRILTRGGVFLYPQDSENADMGGRLRLLYEANPMGFIIEQAGGRASTGTQRIMNVNPDDLHQRVPVILGSRDEVDLIDAYHAEARKG
ncbi:class 1 fructose-bisphosphatase [Cognatishimia maritima]|uniref:Fructose-1,6-bisphosphatase class 1 n=1 Tax=Cognatishimia maritima TaxID=870908 RepID=A0A1M5W0Y9_9RHOB|nr:class 1 fructose-bisphosphatase [Cognatishimia maritima]SHH81131.1 D-fructose 1,6-bisphosphatase [Cognatishimia maritima]